MKITKQYIKEHTNWDVDSVNEETLLNTWYDYIYEQSLEQ